MILQVDLPPAGAPGPRPVEAAGRDAAARERQDPRLRRGGLDREARRDAREDPGHHPGDALSGPVARRVTFDQHRGSIASADPSAPCARSTTSRSRCATASSSRCSGPPAAARPRCCAWSPAFASSTAAASCSATSASTRCRRTGATPAWCSRTTPCFPNLTVGGNVAYGLQRAQRCAASEIDERVARALKLVQLDGYGERWPHQFSGGQLQRVAIARALVIEPQVLLLDEPLSNLDAKLRVEMRGEIRELQKTLGITVIYVTHDQEEALAISDRIAVMRGGRVEQIGAPREIYDRPATPFVASFRRHDQSARRHRRRATGGMARDRAARRQRLRACRSSRGTRATRSMLLACGPRRSACCAAGEAAPAGWATLAGTT